MTIQIFSDSDSIMLIISKKTLNMLNLSVSLLSSVCAVYGSEKTNQNIAHSKLDKINLANY